MECPYCDGENILPGNGYANNHPRALLTVRYHASIVNACFFCLRASRVFNVAPHKHLTLPSQLAAKRLFSEESAETTNGLANPTVLLIDFASKLDY